MSGTGSSSWWPNIRWDTSWWGSWSTEVAENRFRVRSALTIAIPWVIEPRLWELGLPRYTPKPSGTVLAHHPAQSLGHPVEGLVPADLHPLRPLRRRDPPDGAAQPVGIGLHVGDGHALRAHVPARERVGGVAAHPGDPFPAARVGLDGDLEPADGLTQVAHADARVSRFHHCIVPRPPPNPRGTPFWGR